ncbi:vitellogenin-1-like [Pollicipes pollicipes]|uniref:vitellogenin-1-like n=1 Tax=Pollicipes pollicipes TaxID=41117 RepID=UPI001884AC6E|nr:vitellogenin-1-like [Pollicipes pollicipes]
MASKLLLLLLVSVCAAELGFKPKQQCTYHYEAKQASGIPGLRTQWSAIGLKMDIDIQATTPDSLYVQLKNIKHGELHNELVQQPWREGLPMPWSAVPQFQGPLSEKFKVEMNNGQVRTIVTSQGEPTWVVNIKKSIAQLFQMDLKQQNSIELPHLSQPDTYTAGKVGERERFFRVMEDSIGGECETMYEVTPQLADNLRADAGEELRRRGVSVPEWDAFHPFTVTKTKNYQNCRTRPIWQHLTPPAVSCRADDCHLTASNRSATAYYVLNGESTDFTIQSVVAESEALMFPYGHETEQIWTVTNQTLFLDKCQSMTAGSGVTFMGELRQPKSDSSLQFRYPTVDEQPLRLPDLKSAPQMSTLMPGVPAELVLKQLPPTEIVQRAVQLIQKVDNFLSQVPDPVTQDVAGYVIEIEHALSWLGYEQLKQVQQHMQTPGQKDTFYDMLAAVGTNPAVSLLLDSMQQSLITDARAATVIATLPMNIKTPTVELINQVFHLLTSSRVQTKQSLRMTLSLSLANVFHQVCVRNVSVNFSYASRLYGKPFCSDAMKSLMIQQMIPFLTQQAHQRQEPEKLAYIQALGNIGHKEVIPVLQSFFTVANSPLAASKAIYALYNVNEKYPETIRELVMPVFNDLSRPTEVRLAAVTTVLASNPPIAYWQKVATSTWFEPRIAVVAFIHSAYSSFANNTMAQVYPLFEMSRRARITLPLIRPPPQGIRYSNSFGFAARLISKYQVAYISRTSFISTQDSVVPSVFYGEFQNYINSVVYSSSKYAINLLNVQSVVDSLLFGSKTRQSPRDIGLSSPALRTIERELNIKKPESTGDFQYTMYMRLMGTMDTFFSVDANKYQELLQKARNGGSYSAKQAQKIAYLEDKTVTFPSEIGLPVIYMKKVPLVSSVRGDMQAEWNYQDGTYTAHVKRAQPFVASKSQVMVYTLSPFTLRMLGSGVENKVQVSLPITFQVKLDQQAAQLQMSASLLSQPSPVKVAHIKTMPFTTAVKVNDYTQLTTAPDTKEIIVRKHTVLEVPFGKPFGIKGSLRLVSETPVISFGTFYNEFLQRNSYPHFWYLPSSTRSRHYDLIVDTANSESQKFEATWTYMNQTQVSAPGGPITTMRNPIIESQQHQQKVSEAIRNVMQMMQQSGEETQVGATMTSTITQRGGRQLHYKSMFSWASDADWYTQKLQFRGETPSNKVCLSTSLAFPVLSEARRDLLNGEVSMPLSGQLGFGSSCQESTVTMTGRVQRDSVARQYAQQCSEAQRCTQHERSGHPNSADCRIAKDHAALANNWEFDFTMHNLPAGFRNASYALDYFAKYMWWPYMTNDPYKTNAQNKIVMKVQIDPRINTATAHIMKPFETTKFEQVLMPFDIRYEPYLVTMRKSFGTKVVDSLFGVDKSVCIADAQELKTYNNVTIPGKPSTECWSLLTKDASGAQQIAILHKKIDNYPAVRILVNTRDIEISRGSSIQLKVDGRPQQISTVRPLVLLSDSHETLVRLSVRPDGTVKVSLPQHMVQLKLTTEAVLIQASHLAHRGKLTGLCGNFDGERQDEMIGPQGCKFTKAEPFFKTYTVPLDGGSQQCRPQLVDPRRCVRPPTPYNWSITSSGYRSH